MEYEKCPRFGTEDCCGTSFKKFLEHVSEFRVNLVTRSGQKISITPWIVGSYQEFDNSWTAVRMQNPEYEEIVSSALTSASRIKYAQFHHTGIITTIKYKNCPFLNKHSE